jgi:signal peptidase I
MPTLQRLSQKTSGGALGTVKTIFYAILIAIGIRSFLFEPFHIPSGSMIPTLLVGDYLFVEKHAYGYSHFSFPFGLNLFSGRVFGGGPRRGDVVVFRKPTDVSIDYIKRIVGLPGDRIQMKNGLLWINGQPVKRERTVDYVDAEGRAITQYVETLPYGMPHVILKTDGDNGPLDNTEEVLVEPGHYFAMGDNRDDSLDSRTTEVGQIPAENLIGRAEVIFFSWNSRAPGWEIWNWPFAVRYGRLLDLIR